MGELLFYGANTGHECLASMLSGRAATAALRKRGTGGLGKGERVGTRRNANIEGWGNSKGAGPLCS